MYTMDLLLIIGIILLVIGIMLTVKVFNVVSKESPSKRTDSSEGKLVLGDDYVAEEPVSKTDDSHMITTLYLYKEKSSVWICPNCEVENPITRTKCCVCNQIIKE